MSLVKSLFYTSAAFALGTAVPAEAQHFGSGAGAMHMAGAMRATQNGGGSGSTSDSQEMAISEDGQAIQMMMADPAYSPEEIDNYARSECYRSHYRGLGKHYEDCNFNNIRYVTELSKDFIDKARSDAAGVPARERGAEIAKAVYAEANSTITKQNIVDLGGAVVGVLAFMGALGGMASLIDIASRPGRAGPNP